MTGGIRPPTRRRSPLALTLSDREDISRGIVPGHYVMLTRVKSKDTESVIKSLIKQAHKLPQELAKSLTWDRGKEMADHKRFSLATDIKVYF